MANLAPSLSSYQYIKARIQEVEDSIDEQTLADTVEGLTDLHEIIATIVRSAVLDEALADGLRSRIDEMKERLSRFEKRASARRLISRDAMADAQIKRITAPDLTISLRPGVRSLIVIDEKLIPEEFWEPQAPRLRRQELVGELKRERSVPGAELSHPVAVLSVRGK